MSKNPPAITADIVNQMQKYAPGMKGIPCPFKGGITCGTFGTLKEYDDWSGEKYCRASCYIGRGTGKKLAGGIDMRRKMNDGIQSLKLSSPRRMAAQLYDSQQRKAYEIPAKARRVA